MSSTVLTNLTSKEFGYVFLAGAGIAFQCIIAGFSVGGARGKVFDAEYYRQDKVKALLDEHKKATGDEKLPQGGYPDMGNGRYSDLLSYDKWLLFNNAQRAHQNYVEGVASVLTVLTISGLTWNPKYAGILGGVYILGREVYRMGYSSKGANGRLAGVVTLDLALLGLLGTSFYGSLKVAQLIK